MALTTIKTGGLADNSVTDAKVADAITVTGAQTGITQVGTLTAGTWNAGVIASAYLDADTAHLSGSTFTGALIVDPSSAVTSKISSYPDYNFEFTGGDQFNVRRDNGDAGQMHINYTGGNVQFGQTTGNAYLNDNGTPTYAFKGDTDTGMHRADTNAIGFYTTSSERMRIDSSGNVGIGTDNPSAYDSAQDDLVIAGTGNRGMSIISASDSNSTIAFGDSTGVSGYQGMIAYLNADNAMTFRTTATERMRISSAGKVGIGKTDPVHELSIATTATSGPALELQFDLDGSIVADHILGEIIFSGNDANINSSGGGQADNTSIGAKIVATATAGWDDITSNDADDSPSKLEFYTQNAGADNELASPRMTIDSGGKVGIGTASPHAELEIADGNCSFMIDPNDSADKVTLYAYDWNGTAYNDIVMGNDAVTIKANGKVGIGTTNPHGRLHVHTETDDTDETGDCALTLGSETSGKMKMYFGINDANNYTYIGSVETAVAYRSLALQPNGGNVGIGTTSPGAPLHILKNAGLNSTVELLRLDMNEGSHVGGKGGAIVWKDISVYDDCLSLEGVRDGVSSHSRMYVRLRESTTAQFEVSSQGYIKSFGSSVHTSSDETLKKNISTIPSALDKVNQMRGVQFKWKKEHDVYDENHQYHQRVNIGFIAQELEDVVPEIVDTHQDTGIKSVQDANQINALLVEAVKELSAKVTALENA